MASDTSVTQGPGGGWVPTAMDGIRQTLDVADEKRIRIIVNGGARNPKGMAEKVHEMVSTNRFPFFFVAFVTARHI